MRPALFLRVFLCGCAAAALSGCKVGPKYHEPHPWSPAHYADHAHDDANGPAPSAVTEARAATRWWETFGDPELSSLEERLLTQNLSFRLATANLAESRAQLMLAGAERFPGLSASGSYQRSQYSTQELREIIGKVGGGLDNSFGSNTATYIRQAQDEAAIPLLNQWNTQIDATYEIDLWGRVAHQYEAAKADLQATDEERRAVLIAQQADMARGYLTLRGDQARLKVLQDSLATLQGIASIAADRYRSGLVTELDVDSARARVQDTQAELASLRQTVGQEENAIALLLGAPPGSLNAELEKPAAVPAVPPQVPAGLPSELAHRRPDIREAEAKLRAAVAEVGQATADFYPKVTINADFGVQTLSFKDLGMWNSRAWNIGPSISIPIFQGGRLRGQLELKKASQKAAAISYQQTVIQTWHDVDNALIAYRDEQFRRQGLAREAQTQGRATDLARSQYSAGLTNYLNVLDAQTRLQAAQENLAASDATVATNLARLYNALGGGWQDVLPDSAAERRALTDQIPAP